MSRDAAGASVTLPDLLAAVFDGPAKQHEKNKSERHSKGKKTSSAAVGRSSSAGGVQDAACENSSSPAQARKSNGKNNKRASGFFSFFSLRAKNKIDVIPKEGFKEQQEAEGTGNRPTSAAKFGSSLAHAQSTKDLWEPQKLAKMTQNSKNANVGSTSDAIAGSHQPSGLQRSSRARHSRNQSDMAVVKFGDQRRG